MLENAKEKREKQLSGLKCPFKCFSIAICLNCVHNREDLWDVVDKIIIKEIKTFSLCFHSLVKTEAKVWESLTADQ